VRTYVRMQADCLSYLLRTLTFHLPCSSAFNKPFDRVEGGAEIHKSLRL